MNYSVPPHGVGFMSALPPKADMDRRGCDVRFVPKADLQGFATYVRLNSDYGTAGC